MTTQSVPSAISAVSFRRCPSLSSDLNDEESYVVDASSRRAAWACAKAHVSLVCSRKRGSTAVRGRNGGDKHAQEASVCVRTGRTDRGQCINNGSRTDGPVLRQRGDDDAPNDATFSGGSRALNEATADAIISNSSDNSTFYLGFAIGGGGPFFFIPDSPTFDPATVLAPGFSTNSVSHGACAAGTRIPGIPGSSFMCASGYGAQSNPDYVAGKSSTETISCRDLAGTTRSTSKAT